MTINNNRENLRQESNYCHKSTNDEGAIIMMCRKDEEPQLNVVACLKITMACACCKAMDTPCR
jgi:hypothetical protein